MEARKRAVWYLRRWIGTFYLWGGSDPSGFDCSGLVIEILKGVGKLPHDYDNTAHGLWELFRVGERGPIDVTKPGDLIFWFKDDFVYHVEMAIDAVHSIGASGGGSKTLTIADAIKHDAFVKMRPYTYRGFNFKVCNPFQYGGPS